MYYECIRKPVAKYSQTRRAFSARSLQIPGSTFQILASVVDMHRMKFTFLVVMLWLFPFTRWCNAGLIDEVENIVGPGCTWGLTVHDENSKQEFKVGYKPDAEPVPMGDLLPGWQCSFTNSAKSASLRMLLCTHLDSLSQVATSLECKLRENEKEHREAANLVLSVGKKQKTIIALCECHAGDKDSGKEKAKTPAPKKK